MSAHVTCICVGALGVPECPIHGNVIRVDSPAEAAQWQERRMDNGAAERRRYALFSSTTQILCGLFGNDERVSDAIDLAEGLLTEIERRERKPEPNAHLGGVEKQ